MRPVDVLAARDELHRDIHSNEFFRGHVRNVLDLRYTAGMTTINNPDMLLQSMASAVKMSEVFIVSEDMAAVAEHAQKTMPGEPFSPQDLPSTHGFMWINGGIQTPDIRDVVNSTSALVWATFGGGIVLLAYAWKYDKKDEINQEISNRHESLANMPLLTWTGYAVMLKFGDVPHSQTRIKDTSNIKLDDEITVEDSEDGFGDIVKVNGEQVEVIKAEPSHELSWFLAACRLMQQTVARPTREEVPAKKVRRFDLKDNTVTVIQLRRSAHGPSDGETHVQWSHRWVVRGHWRYAHAKDEDGNWIRRWVYINPHFRGPADAPLLVRDKVNWWKR